MVRTYETPAGVLRHAVRRTDDEGDGWPVQPDCVPIIEDYNIPRAVEHAVSKVDDIDAIAHLYAPPSEADKKWFAERMTAMQAHSDRQDLYPPGLDRVRNGRRRLVYRDRRGRHAGNGRSGRVRTSDANHRRYRLRQKRTGRGGATASI